MPRAIHYSIQISGAIMCVETTGGNYCPRVSALVHFARNFPRKLVKVAYHWPTANRITCALVKTCCHWLKAVN